MEEHNFLVKGQNRMVNKQDVCYVFLRYFVGGNWHSCPKLISLCINPTLDSYVVCRVWGKLIRSCVWKGDSVV